MTPELISQRLMELSVQLKEKQNEFSDLEAQKEKVLNDMNAISGAIQDCKYWAGEFIKVETKKGESKNESV